MQADEVNSDETFTTIISNRSSTFCQVSVTGAIHLALSAENRGFAIGELGPYLVCNMYHTFFANLALVYIWIIRFVIFYSQVVLIKGHFLSFLPLCSRNEPVFLAACSPIAMPETRECVVQGATNVFTTIHSMDMKIMHIDKKWVFLNIVW